MSTDPNHAVQAKGSHPGLRASVDRSINPMIMRRLCGASVLLWLSIAPDASAPCSSVSKQKAIYASSRHEPNIGGATDVIVDVFLEDVEDIYRHGGNGIFNAHPIGFVGTSVSGYFGPQLAGSAPRDAQQVLFSLWDGGSVGLDSWRPALPMMGAADANIPGTTSCRRNCNDCAVHDGPVAADGSTGTSCKVKIPAYQGQRTRLRVRRIAQSQQSSAYGQLWTGDVWEVTIRDMGTGQEWVVGRQLVSDSAGGINRLNHFHEHLGCTTCGTFYARVSRGGPWVLAPSGVSLASASSSFSNVDGCHRQAIYGSPPGMPGHFTVETGRGVPDTAGLASWDKVLYQCGTGGCAPPLTENGAQWTAPPSPPPSPQPPLPQPQPPLPPPPPLPLELAHFVGRTNQNEATVADNQITRGGVAVSALVDQSTTWQPNWQHRLRLYDSAQQVLQLAFTRLNDPATPLTSDPGAQTWFSFSATLEVAHPIEMHLRCARRPLSPSPRRTHGRTSAHATYTRPPHRRLAHSFSF